MSDEKYYAGNIWEAPSYRRGIITLSGAGAKLMLVSDPTQISSSLAFVEPDGTWLYTLEELKIQLKGWKWIKKLK